MNRLAATQLVALVGFVAWFSWHAWQTEKSFVIREQENVLEFASRHVDGYFLRIESGFLRLSLELTEGRGQQTNMASLLLNGLKTRNRDFLHLSLKLADGTTLMTGGRQSDEDRPLPHPEANFDPDEKSGLYRNFWNAEIQEKLQLAIEQETGEFADETQTLITTYHHSDETGRFRHTLSGILRMSILHDYWLSTETLKQSHFWIAGDNGSLIQLYPARTDTGEEIERNRTIATSLQDRLRQSEFPIKGKFEKQWDAREGSQVAVFQRLKSYPFTVVLSVPRTIILARWWHQVQTPFALAFMFFLLGLISYLNTVRNQRIRELEAQRIQEQFHINNERRKLALECAETGLWEANLHSNGICLTWQAPDIADLPESSENVPLADCIGLVHPEDRSAVQEKLNHYFSSSTSEFQIEFRLLGKQRQWKWHLARGNAIKRDHDGKPIHVLGTLTDINLQKTHLLQLEEREGQFRQGFILFPTGVCVLSKSGSIIEANPALCRMFGYSEGEMVGVQLEHFFEKGKVNGNLFDLDFSTTENHFLTTLERSASHKSGYRFPVVCKLSAISRKDGETHNFIAQIEDLSERKQIQLQDTAKEVLRAQEQDRAELSRELHDEVGQSLTALKLTLKLTQDGLSDVQKTGMRLHEGQRILDDLIGSIRNIANRIRPSTIDQLGLVSAVRAYLAKNIRPLGQQAMLTENIGESRLPEALELCCFRVIQEALTNCLRHAQASSINVSLTLESSKFLLSVQDNGAGFDISHYYALRGKTRSLGIIGMHERVAAVGGHLQIRSTPGQGTEVVAAFDLTGAT